jgi:hypothetical protein
MSSGRSAPLAGSVCTEVKRAGRGARRGGDGAGELGVFFHRGSSRGRREGEQRGAARRRADRARGRRTESSRCRSGEHEPSLAGRRPGREVEVVEGLHQRAGVGGEAGAHGQLDAPRRQRGVAQDHLGRGHMRRPRVVCQRDTSMGTTGGICPGSPTSTKRDGDGAEEHEVGPTELPRLVDEEGVEGVLSVEVGGAPLGAGRHHHAGPLREVSRRGATAPSARGRARDAPPRPSGAR